MKRFFAQSPATSTLALLWILAFLAMCLAQSVAAKNQVRSDEIWAAISYQFGNFRPTDLLRGQVWRALTATFLHAGLFHLVINLLGLIQLGRWIEEWYGSARTFLIAIVIGLVGNLLSAGVKFAVLPVLPEAWDAIRSFVGGSLEVPGVGGSVTVCGLVGLIAVVGGRSSTRFGQFVRNQMLAVLGFTMLLGFALAIRDDRPILDNLGHAGGAAVGAVIGWFHKRLLRPEEGPAPGRAPAWIGGVILVACFGAQGWLRVVEGPIPTTLFAGPSPTRGGRVILSPERQLERCRIWKLTLLQVNGHYREMSPRPSANLRPAERVFARWAFREGVPAQHTAIIPPWPESLRFPAIDPEQRRRHIAALDQFIEILRRLGPPDADEPIASIYRQMLEMIGRAHLIRPTEADHLRFLGHWIRVLGWIDGQEREAIASLDAAEADQQGTPSEAPREPTEEKPPS